MGGGGGGIEGWIIVVVVVDINGDCGGAQGDGVNNGR